MRKNPWNAIVIGVVLLFTGMLAAGCSGPKKAEKDAFFDKWHTMSQTATGHSPVFKPKSVELPPEVSKSQLPPGVEAKKLPKMMVSLKMRQADVKAVVRSLARIADQNILIKNEIKGEITVDFRGISWDQAFNSILRAQGLTYVWEGDILRVISAEDMDRDMKIEALTEKRRANEMASKLIDQLHIVIVNVDYADVKSMQTNLQEFLTKDKDGKPRGSVKVDEHSNSLIIHAIRDDLTRMIPIIEKIDKPTPQILIKAHIVETSKETARQLGILWGGSYKAGVGDHNLYLTPGGGSAGDGTGKATFPATGFTGTGMGVYLPSFSGATAGSPYGALGLSFGTLAGNIVEVQLNALQTEGVLNILSSPSITTLDNQKAYTENGEKVPVVSTDNEGNRTVRYEDAVLRLEIKPHVIDGTNLKMGIIVKKDEVDTTRTVDNNPFIIKKQTETSLIVRDGETIVISGLTKQNTQKITTGIPALKDVPLLGWLFKGEDKSETMQEVLVFITPKILPPYVTAAAEEPNGKRKPQETPEQKATVPGS